jgi:hypothetical protein
MPTQGQVSLWGEWGVTRIRRRIILRRRCQFAAAQLSYFSKRVSYRLAQATLSGTPFSSFAINPTYLLDSFLRIHLGDTSKLLITPRTVT